MLIEFSVRNFRSIKGEQAFSFVATKRKELQENVFKFKNQTPISLLKTAVIYGANASGKTNIIKAFDNFLALVVNSTNLKLDDKIDIYEPYKLDKNYINRSTKFKIEFIGLDKVRYKYRVKYNKNEILFEELLHYPRKQRALLFSREKGKPLKFGEYLKGKKQNIASELIPNNLFLSRAANSNHEQLKDIYLYFRNCYTVIAKSDFDMNFPRNFTSRKIVNDEATYYKNMVERFLCAADTGISSIDVKKKDIDKAKHNFPDGMPQEVKDLILEDYAYELSISHQLYEDDKTIGTTDFDLNEESEGTKKLYGLAGVIIETLATGGVMIIDELDSSLHPIISSFIIKLFNDPKKNPKNSQLIIATHDTSLLKAKLFRRDQIWFVEKKTQGSSELYSLVEFNTSEVRKTTPYDNWYLTGRFGALPVLKDINFDS